mgnify:CR=1 FL=1
MQFLRGDISGKNTTIRPPWSGDEAKFIDTCTSCGDCIDKCPTKIIQKGRGNYTVINFSKGECIFCNDCVDACEVNALKVTDTKPWLISATIDNETCLASQGIECRSCYDPCEVRAIKMTPLLSGVSTPSLDANLCTGCGACFAICPGNSISMNTNQ